MLTKIPYLILFYFTSSFNAFPGTNFGTVLAGISISVPVCGFLPFLADLWATLKLPN
jgi:hypothetical protein